VSRHPDEAALKRRARAMLVAMTEREHWIYALERAVFGKLVARIEAAGIARAEEADEGRVVRFGEDDRRRFVAMDSEALDAALLEGSGADAVPLLKELLDELGFVPQSQLWAVALDVGQPKAASRALRTLAHMMVAWDEDFCDLFLLHLASPDAIARHEAVLAISLAAMVARDTEPALELLTEAKTREKYPKLAATIEDAVRILRDAGGHPRQVVE
jgi:hypothetical protein